MKTACELCPCHPWKDGKPITYAHCSSCDPNPKEWPKEPMPMRFKILLGFFAALFLFAGFFLIALP